MIAKLSGILDSISDDRTVIDVNGVGYLVFASGRTLGKLGQVGGQVGLLIETHVREDHIHLYGFADRAEQDWFRVLTTVQGVGAKVALAILGVLGPDELIRAISAQDKTMLTRASGVGPKLAARIVSELKDKAPQSFNVVKHGPDSADIIPSAAQDALSALLNLGYRRPEAEAALRRAIDNGGGTLDQLIRSGLKELAR